MDMKEIVDMLREGKYSCVVRNGQTRAFAQRGVADVYWLLKNEPSFLQGASVADKVVGKGAAALFVLGKVRELYADVVSAAALDLLARAGIEVSYREKVPAILSATGPCPLEARCAGEDSAAGILPIVDNFIKEKIAEQKTIFNH
jgi:iron complex outermembrane receptor protein